MLDQINELSEETSCLYSWLVPDVLLKTPRLIFPARYAMMPVRDIHYFQNPLGN